MTPKASMTTMSHTFPASLYTPMMQKSRMRGKSRPYGTRSSWTQRPIRGRFRMSRITLPTYMLAITPQNMSGCSRIRSGPGWTPWMRKAPSRTAMTTLGAMPRVSRGIIAPPVAALLAASGAAVAEALRVPRDAPLQRVGDKGGDDGADPRQDAEEEAQHAAARDGG